MDPEKSEFLPVTVLDPSQYPSENNETIDNTHITILEKPADIETDSLPDKNELQSEFLEVRAAVDLEDNVNMPAETFRAYTIGILFTLLGAIASNITSLREQPLVVSASIVQLVSLPVGRLWAKLMPDKTLTMGKYSLRLNPGPFTIKEHTLITVMANVGVGYPPYAVDLVLVQIAKYSKGCSK